MSVFDILKNNQGREDVGVYMSYQTYEMYLTKAQEEERQRIWDAIQKIEDRSHATRTPLFQDTLFDLIRKAINESSR